ncbi:MAG: hypothetical protein Q9N67_09230 [Ghiorsea sp.]|nr:hypothetical protein [Ghiorsea sp.]
MGTNHYQFMRRKQRRKRIIVISLVCIVLSVIAVSVRECNQNIVEPLDQKYRPFDQSSSPLE